MKYATLTCILVFFVLFALGQQRGKKLRIGDRLPDVMLSNVLNLEMGQVQLADFQGKPLILDFWDVYCVSCIKQFPKTEALQEVFGDSIRILLVTQSTEEEVLRLKEQSEIVRNCGLPMVVDDTTLTRRFPLQTFPAYAWVDAKGVIREFTGSAQGLDEPSVRKFIKGGHLDLAVKDEWGDFNPREPLVTEGRGRNLDKLMFYSMLTGWVNYDNPYNGFLVDSVSGKPNGMHIVNHSMCHLFLQAYQDSLPAYGFQLRDNRIILDIPDVDDYFIYSHLDDYDQWKRERLFCYESRVPVDSAASLLRIMQDDMRRFFGFDVRVVRTNVECMVLKRIDKAGKYTDLTSGGGTFYQRLPTNGDLLSLRNASFGSLLVALDILFNDPNQRSLPFVNDTGYPVGMAIDIDIAGNLRDLRYFNSQLNRFGLELVAERKSIPMLYITDQGSSSD